MPGATLGYPEVSRGSWPGKRSSGEETLLLSLSMDFTQATISMIKALGQFSV